MGVLQDTVIPSNKGLTLETSASESLYSGQFTLSTQLMISKLPSSSIRIVSIHKFYIGITKSMAKTFHHTILGLPSVMHLQCVLCLTCKPEKKKLIHVHVTIINDQSQELIITWSLHLPHIPVTAFSQTDL